jgi:hypothetical protein
VFDKQKGTNFYLTHCTLDTVMVPTSVGGPAGAYGYWMQPAADDRT